MSNGIFTIQPDGTLVETIESAFSNEDIFQKLLADHPNLIAGDQVDPDEPRRWLLVKREAGVPDEEDAADRWSVDHLFLDQDGIPTFIEVKRSTDTRVRREVVGQMLDYAANAVTYWKADGLQVLFEGRCKDEGRSPAGEYAALLGVDANIAEFWERVQTNLQARKIRMVFVADIIPPELRSIVEFLNEQMNPAEMLALEIKQYVGGGLTTLVPRVFGQTEGARRKHPRATGKQWDEASFLAETERRVPASSAVIRRVLEWARARKLRLWWGRGNLDGSLFPMLDHGGKSHSFVAFWTSGQVQMQFGQMLRKAPFDDEPQRRELQQRLNKIPGVAIPDSKLSVYPGFPIAVVAQPAAVDSLLAALDWFLERVRSGTP